MSKSESEKMIKGPAGVGKSHPCAKLVVKGQEDPELEAMLDEIDAQEDRMFEALWFGSVDGEDFDGDPADLW